MAVLKKNSTIKDALAFFEEAALRHTEATMTGDYKIANKAFNDIIKARTFLQKIGEESALQIFFSHQRAGVKTWAAAFLLKSMEHEAISALKEVSLDENKVIAGNAAMTLKEWEAGRLNW